MNEEGSARAGFTRRIRALVLGQAAFFRPLFEEAKADFDIVEVAPASLSRLRKLAFLAWTIRPKRAEWRREWVYRCEKTPWVFRHLTARNARLLAPQVGSCDVILVPGAMAALGLGSLRPPFCILTDSTRALSSRNTDDTVSHFRNARHREEWLALEGRHYREASRIFVGSDFVRRSLLDDYGVAPERVITTGFGPSLGPSGRYAKSFDGKTILYVGKGDFEKKGGEVLLRAFRVLREQVPEASLHVVGQGKLRPMPGLVDHGFVAGRDSLRNLMRAAQLLVLPSLVDRFGIVIVEAMSEATPVVASDYGAMPEILADAGIVVPRGDADALSRAMLALLRDSDLARRMGEVGRDRHERIYNWERIWKVIRSEVEQVVAEAAREGGGQFRERRAG